MKNGLKEWCITDGKDEFFDILDDEPLWSNYMISSYVEEIGYCYRKD